MDLLRLAFSTAGIESDFRILADGDQAFKYVDLVDQGNATCPCLFILDLNLPKRSGRDVLQRIRRSPACRTVPVVVLSSSSADQDKKDAGRLGADAYITKPADLDEFLQVGELLRPYLP